MTTLHRPMFKCSSLGPVIENSPILTGQSFQMPPHVSSHVIKRFHFRSAMTSLCIRMNYIMNKIQQLISTRCDIQSSESNELLISRNYINRSDIQIIFCQIKTEILKSTLGTFSFILLEEWKVKFSICTHNYGLHVCNVH